MGLVVNLKILLFCNALKHKDNLKCRLEAGAPRKDFFNTLEDACAPHGLGPGLGQRVQKIPIRC